MKKIIALTAVLSLVLSVGFQPRKEIPQAQTQGISGREIKKATHQGMQFSFEGVNGVRSEGMKEGAFVYDFGSTEEDVTVNIDQTWTTAIYVARYDGDPGWPRWSSLPSISDKAVYERGWYRFTQLGWWFYYAVLHTGTVVGGKVRIADFTAPTVTLNGVSNNGITNEGVTVSWADKRGISRISFEGEHTSPDRNIYNGKTVTEEGQYSFRVYDFAGNNSVVRFLIDKRKPFATLIGVANGGTTNGVVTIVYKDNFSLSYVVYTTDEGKFIDKSNLSRTFTSEGRYSFDIYDHAKNKGNSNFVIDKTSPEIKIKNVSTGNESAFYSNNEQDEFHTKENVEINIEDRIYGSVGNAVYHNSGLRDVFVNRRAQFEVTSRPGSINTQLTVKKKITLDKEGTYNIQATDKAGNTTKMKIVIDKTAPSIGGTLQ